MFFSLATLAVWSSCLGAPAVRGALIDATASSFASISASYDFVVVGAGIGGSVMASRLSENSKYNVLLIEAGGDDRDIDLAAIPIFSPALSPNYEWTWNYTVAPQKGLGGRTFPYQRGRAVGGSSVVNYLLTQKGSSDEWNRIATVTGDSGWNWANMQTYLKKWEQWVPPVDGHSLSGQYTPSAHGTSGPILTTINNYQYAADSKIIASASSAYGFPYNQDISSGNGVGLGYLPSSIGKGYRNSASVGYIWNNKAIDRPNLTVLIHAQVTGLTFSSSGVVSGVKFAASKGSYVYTVQASKEVILSAGSVGTPQILMLSGIGPKAALVAKGITSVADLPVGQNLQDHPLITAIYRVNTTETYDNVYNTPSVQDSALTQWMQNHSGKGSNGVGGAVGWSRTPSTDSIWNSYADPSAGVTSPHVESAFCDGWLSATETMPSSGNYLSVVHALVAPASRGTITLASNDPWASPIIDPGFLTSPLDRYNLILNIKKVRTFLDNAPALKGFLGARWGANAAANTDAEIDSFVTKYTSTIWHPSSTASMSKSGATGVTNPDLKVKGFSNLRVVDLSVFPYVTQGHPQGYLYSLSERAAVLVANSWA